MLHALTIFKYTPECKTLLGAKTESEPWLHIAVSSGNYVIYVWDTRQVVESGRSDNAWEHKMLQAKIQQANDNNMPLVGNFDKSSFSYTEMKLWPARIIARQHGIVLPSGKDIEEQIDKWTFRGSTFYGNNAFFASHAKAIVSRYNKNPQHYFNRLVALICITMTTDNGSYNGYERGRRVEGPTFNDILFDADSKATDLARKIMDAAKL